MTGDIDDGSAGGGDAGGRDPSPRDYDLRIWRMLAIILALYVVGQDAMRVLRFSGLDPWAGTLGVTYVRAPGFAPGFVEVTSVKPGGPMDRVGVAKGDHLRFDTDVRNDALPIIGEERNFIHDNGHVQTRRHMVAVKAEARLIDAAQYRRSLLISLSALIAACFALFIIWRGGTILPTLLLGVSLANYSLVNSAPWIGFDSPTLRLVLNSVARILQTVSPVAFIAFSLEFYRQFVGPVWRSAWVLMWVYAAVLLALLGISDYLDGAIRVWPVIGDGQDLYTAVRLAGSVAALACVAFGWRHSPRETRQRYAVLFLALFILVGARTAYLYHLYLWQGVQRQYSQIELGLAIASTTLSAPLFAYAILKHKVLNLGLAISRTLIYGIISFGLLVIFSLVEWGSEQLMPRKALETNVLINAGAALMITIVFDPIKAFVERAVERLLFRSWHENEARLRRFVHDAVQIGSDDVLLDSSIAALRQFAQGAPGIVYLRNGDVYERRCGTWPEAPPVISGDDPVVVAFRTGQSPAEIAPLGTAIAGALVLPMMSRTEVEGFFALGGGDRFRPDEIAVLGWAVEQIWLDLSALRLAKLEQDVAMLGVHVAGLRQLLVGGPAG